MQYLDEYLEGKDFSDQSVMVCGASVLLLNDLYEAPQTNFSIACNHHTLILKPDIVVALDLHTMPLLKQYRGLVCAKHEEADVHIGLAPSFGFSGAAAVWLADYMGFKEVIVAGFSCYLDEGRSYWHDGLAQTKPHINTTREQQEIVWETLRTSLKNPGRIRVMSGFLQNIFKPWREHEHREIDSEGEHRHREAMCHHGGRGEPS